MPLTKTGICSQGLAPDPRRQKRKESRGQRASHTNLLVRDGLVPEWLCFPESGFDDLVSEVLQLWHKRGDWSTRVVETEAR